MHLKNFLFTYLMLIIVLWSNMTASSKTRRWQRSDPWRDFSLHKRKFDSPGRSMEKSATSTPNVAEGRGFMKKFMLFKGMLNQQQHQQQQPQSNIIIITQTTTTTAAPTAAFNFPTTTGGTTSTTAANSPTAIVAARDETSTGFQMANRNNFNSVTNFNAQNVEDIVQNILAGNQNLNRFPRPNRRSGNFNGSRRRRLNQQHHNHNSNRIEDIIKNLSQRPGSNGNVFPFRGTNNVGNRGSIQALASPEGVNFNANSRIQSIVDALRQPQTSIVYNK